MFQALSETEQHAIVGSKASGKATTQKAELVIKEYIPPTASATVPERTSHSPSKLTDQGTENVRAEDYALSRATSHQHQEEASHTSDGESAHVKKGRPKKDTDPEKAAKVRGLQALKSS